MFEHRSGGLAKVSFCGFPHPAMRRDSTAVQRLRKRSRCKADRVRGVDTAVDPLRARRGEISDALRGLSCLFTNLLTLPSVLSYRQNIECPQAPLVARMLVQEWFHQRRHSLDNIPQEETVQANTLPNPPASSALQNSSGGSCKLQKLCQVGTWLRLRSAGTCWTFRQAANVLDVQQFLDHPVPSQASDGDFKGRR